MAQAPAERGELTCTPHGLVNNYPCLACLSDSQLLTVIAMSLYALTHSGNHTLTSMLASGKCFACLSDHQKLQAIASSLISIAVANDYFTDATDATETAQCLSCTDPAIIKGLIVGELCEYINSQWPLAV